MASHELPQLPYGYDALEPHIDARTMEIHHSKHHNAYVTNLNAALEKEARLQQAPIEVLLSDLSTAPEAIRTAVRNNGGGHFNHSLFWSIMGKDKGGAPSGELAKALERRFGSFDSFQDTFAKAATTRFDSGWAWLSLDRKGELLVHSTANQDTPLMEGNRPLAGLDVWEHAYYLKYQNRRPDYIAAWWNVVDWEAVAENYRKAQKG